MPAVSDRWSGRCRCLPHIHSGSARLWRGRNGAGETGRVWISDREGQEGRREVLVLTLLLGPGVCAPRGVRGDIHSHI